MSGKKLAWKGTEAEWMVEHERQMRKRFMQQDIPGITAPTARPVMTPALMPATLQVIREWPEAQATAVQPVRADPPEWYQWVARRLVGKLKRAGFRLVGCKTAVMLRRGAEDVKIMLVEAAPISGISGANRKEEWESGSDAVVSQRGAESAEEVASVVYQRPGQHRA